ncbi:MULTISPECIES: hypothetical protein [unclassified Mesorhizobium]|uniref:hypothetical protein n=1 Tax=unclassified Mesorhizobium TaxID=325217 RepID=UPI0013ECBABE|nr:MULTISPECIES: hypothetical protein [unclassified Mesorhizobium]
MDTALDELSRLLQAPRPTLRSRYGAFAIRIAEGLATGLAIGAGFAIVRALAG